MDLQLIKSGYFGDIQADIYSNGSDMFMTIAQLADCLGYADKSGVEKIVQRNDYLKNPEFSGTDRLSVPNGKGFSMQETRVFTEDGIYEITMLSGQPKARAFRAWVRQILKALRAGKTGAVVPFSEYLEGVGVAAKILRVNEASKSAMLEKAFQSFGLPTEFLPAYVTGNPSFSATALLTRHHASMSAREFNLRMQRAGMLCKESRPSASKGQKHFWSLTEAGLRFGSNQINPKNPRETQPLYYSDTFEELLSYLK